MQAVTPKIIGKQIGTSQHDDEMHTLVFDEHPIPFMQGSKNEHDTDGAQNVWLTDGIVYE